MAVILKVIRHTGNYENYLRNMVGYVTDYRAIVYGGYGVNYTDPNMAFLQMMQVKQYYCQMSTNPLIHLVVSLDGACDNEAFAIQAAPAIAAYFKDCYQLMWCVHHKDEEDTHYHIHILLHSVNVMNGRLFHSGPYEMNGFGYHVKNITGMPVRIHFLLVDDNCNSKQTW